LVKADNTVAAIQHPAKDNSKNTSDGFRDLLKEKCVWHLDDNHMIDQGYQLRRALKDIHEPWPPRDKKVLAVDFYQPRTLVMLWFELHFGTNLPLGILII
jgi:hypothetical protein